MKILEKLDKTFSLKNNLKIIINAIRGDKKDDKKLNLDNVISYLQQQPLILEYISNELYRFLLRSKISTNLSLFGILSKSGFRDEFWNRMYEKFIPAAPKDGDISYLLQAVFVKNEDFLWVKEIETSKWIEFFKTLLPSSTQNEKLKDYLFDELLYTIEILSIWIAAEEFNENFTRLDNRITEKDSPFIALHREISSLIKDTKNQNIDLESTKLDFQHIKVLIDQAYNLISALKKRSVHLGISVGLTYEFERLEEILERLEAIMELIKTFDTTFFYKLLIEFFQESIEKNSTKNSLSDIWNQNIKILARSITNNTSHHGEHYITNTKKEYLGMIGSAAGAGVIISFMALNKIFITSLEFSMFIETIFVSLNYGLGFVLIHLLGFTVATKQPAMTASTFAEAIEEKENKKANQMKLVELFIQVSRSQFAAVIGNVTLALLVGLSIGYFYIFNASPLMDQSKASYYLHSLDLNVALIYAAIAGVWLFCSGLISGYFDNRANYLNLKERYFYHPLLQKITTTNFRQKIAKYLHENHGAIAGNFFFGVLLGITPFLGYIFELPLEIRHIAFSAANLGISTLYSNIQIVDFFLLLGSVLMIGFVNLTVSFMLALKVSLKSRDTYFGSFSKFLGLLLIEFGKRPKEFFFPIEKKEVAQKPSKNDGK